jgi:DNA-binding transcriptional LysR family regulator
MTQPGVSKHLATLESHIGKKLFERTTRKLAPTEFGKFLYEQVNSPLQQLEKVAYYSNKRARKERQAISIGCTEDFFQQELIDKIYSFDMYIATYFASEKELLEALETEKVQLLLGVKAKGPYEHQLLPFKKEELLLLCSKDIEFPEGIEQDETALKKYLKKQHWFLLSNEQEDLKTYWSANFETDFKIVPRYVLPSYTHIVEVLQHNSGCSIVPRHYCEKVLQNKQLKEVLITPRKVEQQLFYSYKLKNRQLPEIKQFIEKLGNNNEG